MANLTETLPEAVVAEARCAPTRVRYGVLAFLSALAMILYLDRICISQAAPEMRRELGISGPWMSCIFAAFTIAYGLFEIPAGHWGDRYGSRGVLARIVIWWSAFTAITGATTGLVTLLLVRFLFGAGEAGAMPNIIRVVGRWFPLTARTRAQGMIVTAAQLGGVLAPVITQYTMSVIGWRWSFAVFGMLGCVWAAAFYTWFRDDPAAHPAVNEAELELITASSTFSEVHSSVPWRLVFRTSSVWILGTVMTCSAFVSYMYMSWYPTYLQEGRGMSAADSSWMASLVMLGGAVGGFFGGYLGDWAVLKTGELRNSRRAIGVTTSLIAALLTLASLHCDSPRLAGILLALSVLSLFSQLASWWAVATEISRPHVGALLGLLNSMGIAGAAASQLMLGPWVDWLKARGNVGRDAWDPALHIYVVVLLVATILWFFIDPRRTVMDSGNATSPVED